MTPTPWKVEVTEEGRGGYVRYREAADTIEMWWEFGGGDAAAMINVGTADEWAKKHPWAATRRDEILRRIGDEVVRRKAPACEAVVDDRGWMSLVPRGRPQGPVGAIAPPSAAARPRDVARPTPAEQHFRFSARRATIVGVLGLVILVVAVFVGMGRSVMQVRTTGTPIASSMRSGTTVMTLISRLEPYIPSLHRDPAKDRYMLGLLLHRVDTGERKYVELGRQREVKLQAVSQLLAVQGDRVWIETPETIVYDIGSGRVTEAADVARDPSLAPPAKEFSYSSLAVGDRVVDLHMASGGRVPGNRWVGIATVEEASASYREGFRVPMVAPFERSSRERRLFLAETAGEGRTMTFVSHRPFGPDALRNGAFLRAGRDGELLEVDSGGLLLMSETKGIRDGTVTVAHFRPDGTIAWSTDTGIHKMLDLLPDAATPAFVGTRPSEPDHVPEPVLVVIDARTGAASTYPLLVH